MLEDDIVKASTLCIHNSISMIPSSNEKDDLAYLEFPTGWNVMQSFQQLRHYIICLLVTQPLAIWIGKIPWNREQLPTPVFWPGELCGLYSPYGHKELNTTERL